MSGDVANPNTPYPQAPTPSTPWGMLYEFLKGQPFNNILTLILLSCVVALGYAAYLSIPVHLKQIQDGYDRNATTFERVSEKQLEVHEKAVKAVSEAMKEDRELSRKHQRDVINLILEHKLGSDGIPPMIPTIGEK